MEENLEKTYLKPDYDDDFDDSDFDEDIDEDGEDELIENFLDKQENLKNNSSKMMPNSAFSTSTPWGNPQNTNTPGSLWNNSNPSPTSSPIWGSNQPSGGSWGSNVGQNLWNNNRPNNTWGNNSWSNLNTDKKEINRKKKIIFCDVLDCLVETYQSCGKPGLLPRGIYDIKFRFDVWDKLACFNPEKIFAMVPRSLINSSNENSWMVLLEYIVCSLSEYLRSPYQVCQILLQTKIGQPKEDTMVGVLKGLNKDDVIHLGVNSGLYGQNNKDQIAAMRCGIDYIDLATFMNSYY